MNDNIIMEITKAVFLEKAPFHYEGDDIKGYTFIGINFFDFEIKEVTDNMASTMDDLKTLLESDDIDEITELNNSIMNWAFAEGNNFQGSYEEVEGSGEYNWYLDFGKVEFQPDGKEAKYVGVRLYNGNLKQ
ncbi:MAG: hypothetical protein P8H40_07770 [Winogradskyella sp.]|nr:hypothetical protein [Winogradskyella sp.]